MTVIAGLGVEARFVGWGAGIVDLDNDGTPDLFFVTGNIYPEVAARLPQYGGHLKRQNRGEKKAIAR